MITATDRFESRFLMLKRKLVTNAPNLPGDVVDINGGSSVRRVGGTATLPGGQRCPVPYSTLRIEALAQSVTEEMP